MFGPYGKKRRKKQTNDFVSTGEHRVAKEVLM
jgi:hypothetical protein